MRGIFICLSLIQVTKQDSSSKWADLSKSFFFPFSFSLYLSPLLILSFPKRASCGMCVLISCQDWAEDSGDVSPRLMRSLQRQVWRGNRALSAALIGRERGGAACFIRKRGFPRAVVSQSKDEWDWSQAIIWAIMPFRWCVMQWIEGFTLMRWWCLVHKHREIWVWCSHAEKL